MAIKPKKKTGPAPQAKPVPWYLTPQLRPLPCPGNYIVRDRITTFTRVPFETSVYGASWFDISDERGDGQMVHVLGEMDADRTIFITEHRVVTSGMADAIADIWLICEAVHRLNVKKAPKRAKIGSIRGVLRWFCEPSQLDKAVSVGLDDQTRRVTREWVKNGAETDKRPRHPPFSPLLEIMDLTAAMRHLQGMVYTGDLRVHEDQSDLLRDLSCWSAVPSEASVGAVAVLAAGLREMTAPPKRKRPSFVVDNRQPGGWA